MGTCLRFVCVTTACLLVCASLSPEALAGRKGKVSPSRQSRAEKGRKSAKDRKAAKEKVAKASKAKVSKKGRRAGDDDDDRTARSRRGRKQPARAAKNDQRRARGGRQAVKEEVAEERAVEREEARVSYPVVPDQIEVIEYGSERARGAEASGARRVSASAGSRAATAMPSVSKRRLGVAISEERVSEIQQALTRKGYFAGELTGAWDDATYEAMRRFQFEHKIDVTGYPTAHALKLLGLTDW
jgi:hypothetical protein